MSFDLSPLRPWVWLETDAYEWNYATDYQRSFKQGMEDGKAKAKAVAGRRAEDGKVRQAMISKFAS